ncbi:hypothetical protein SASPL_108619 [Salvia splendens]|uniref:Uncharacterized protein n=1 Tax=Salvia splendens TaxID=180675 RepID=A0A8X8YF29_SALSN|nr:hypothetical protein SASPL_108619 [Salvia splendens]
MIRSWSKPLFAFIGEAFESVKEVLLDLFRGEVGSVPLANKAKGVKRERREKAKGTTPKKQKQKQNDFCLILITKSIACMGVY